MTQTILLADDSVTIQKVVELTFMDGDYHVVAVGNGADGAGRLDDVQPDVVIADVHMPGLNGFDLCRRVKQWRPQTPVLLLVGTFEPFDREQYAASGADGHLKKPFDSQELQRQVDELLGRAAPGSNAAAAASVEPDWMAGDADTATALMPEPPEPAAPWSPEPAGWQQEAPVALRNNEGAPDVSGRPQAVPAAWSQPAPDRPAPPADEASWLTNRTAKISDEIMRSAVAGVDSGDIPLAAVAPAAARELSDAEVERIAQRVATILGERVVREVSWEVIPDLAEVIIKDRIRELEAQVE